MNKEVCCKRHCLGYVNKAVVVDNGEVSEIYERVEPMMWIVDEDDGKETVTTIYTTRICNPSEVPIIHKILNSLPGGC